LANWVLLKVSAVPLWLSLLVVLLPSAVLSILFGVRPAAWRSVFRSIEDALAAILSFVGIAGVFLLVQFCWFAWQARALNPALPANRPSVAPAANVSRTRVIWILLDELSYQQVYERRFPGVDLPAFDRLATQSTMFTHVVPAGIATEEVVLSLLTGVPIDKIRVSSNGRLQSLHISSGGWQPFDPLNTIIQDAHAAGYGTGIAGWYNPYCRILPQVLDRCFWIYRDSLTELLHRVSIAGTLSSLDLLASHLLHSPRFSRWHRQLHIDDYTDIREASDVLLSDPSVDFVFLHLPVPHPEGIFDRKQMTFATRGASYLDNLVLADQYLAHVRLVLEQQHQWDSSLVIVMGDHSWRASLLYRGFPGWTQEEEQASHAGEFDDRPAYLVKMPMEKTALRVDAPFKAIDTRELLNTIIRNHVNSPTDLRAWVLHNR
jgi:hypothetical protein